MAGNAKPSQRTEVPVKVVEMRLTEQVAMERKKNWHLHQQVEEIGKPRTERPERSDESKFQVVRAANLAEDSLDLIRLKGGKAYACRLSQD